MSLETITILGIKGLPDSVGIIDLFHYIYSALGWDSDEHGKKPFGLDLYFIPYGNVFQGNELKHIKVNIVRRKDSGKFSDEIAVEGNIARRASDYVVGFKISESAMELYAKPFEEYKERLSAYFRENLGLTDVTITEVEEVDFKDEQT